MVNYFVLCNVRSLHLFCYFLTLLSCFMVIIITIIIINDLIIYTNVYVCMYVRARSHTGVMDYDEACFMHLTPGVVHNFPKAVGV